MLRIADDFGLGRGHDRVILNLLDQGALDGTSVMVDGAMAPVDLVALVGFRKAGVQVGLHLNLTEALGAAPVWPLSRLLRGVPAEARAIFAAQFDRFTDLFGFAPDFIDGHQHCHILPGAPAMAASLPRAQGCWMRLPLPRAPLLAMRSGGAKVAVIMALARWARPVFAKAGWPMNDDFSGFLRLDDPESVERWLPHLLEKTQGSGVLMLHPGDGSDPATCPGHAPQCRAIEARILSTWHRPPA